MRGQKNACTVQGGRNHSHAFPASGAHEDLHENNNILVSLSYLRHSHIPNTPECSKKSQYAHQNLQAF